MQTVYVLMPVDVAKRLQDGKPINPEEIPDPWEESDKPIAAPEGMINTYKDDLAAKSEQQLAQALMNIKLAMAKINVPDERLTEWRKDQAPDPSARLLSLGINQWELDSIFYP